MIHKDDSFLKKAEDKLDKKEKKEKDEDKERKEKFAKEVQESEIKEKEQEIEEIKEEIKQKEKAKDKGIDITKVAEKSVCGKCLGAFDPQSREGVQLEETGKKFTVNKEPVYLVQHPECKSKPVSQYVAENTTNPEKGFIEVNTSLVE